MGRRNGIPTSGKNLTQTLSVRKRRSFCLRMREMGLNYEEIADRAMKKFGPDRLPDSWDRRYAWRDVHHCLDKAAEEVQERAEDVLDLELRRLDKMMAAILPYTQRRVDDNGTTKPPDYAAIDRVLKIQERRSKLLGLDAPERHAHLHVDVDWSKLSDEQLEAIADGQPIEAVISQQSSHAKQIGTEADNAGSEGEGAS